MALLNSKAAAERLGISPRRLLAYIADGRLPAVKVGRDWVIEEADLAGVVRQPQGNHSGRSRRKPRDHDATADP